MAKKSLLAKFLIWRMKHISQRQFVLVLSALVGLASGLAAVILKNAVHYIKQLLTSSFISDFNYLYFAYPVIGILITILFVKYVLRQPVGHGIPAVLYAISKKNSIMKRHNMFSSMISSTLTVGFGGSAGLEGPTVATGSSIGSNIGRTLHLNYKTITLLLGCGAAGAMAGIFNAPIAAIVFALEVIMLDLTLSSLVPLLVASASAALVSNLLMGSEILFKVSLTEFFEPSDVPFYILLGLLCGTVSVYFIRVYWLITERFAAMKNRRNRLLTGGLLLGIIVFLIPPIYGEGYETIYAFLNNDYEKIFLGSPLYEYRSNIYIVLLLLAVMLLIKVIATTITFSAGGVGGIFAPSLFIGATAGFIFAKSLVVFDLAEVSIMNFTLMGMCGLMAGVLHAPLTAIFLIAEITSGYELFMPLLITSTFSFITSRYFTGHSIYTLQLAKRGELITHDKDQAVLTLMSLHTEVEKNFLTVKRDSTLGELVKVVAKSTRNIFPVVDEEGGLEGIVLLDNIREIMFNPDLYDEIKVENLMVIPPTTVSSRDTMDSVMEKFKVTNVWNLPVVDDGKYIGFVSKSKLFNAYRKILLKLSKD